MGNIERFEGLKDSFLGIQSYNATLKINTTDSFCSYIAVAGAKSTIYNNVNSFEELSGVVVTLIGSEGGQWFLPKYNDKFVGMIKICDRLIWTENIMF